MTNIKLLQASFVWPNMHKVVQHFCKTYKPCQKATNQKLLYGPIISIFSCGPFENWKINAIGLLPHTSSWKEYLILAIDYMHCWEKAASPSQTPATKAKKFVFDYICNMFGFPLDLLSNRGPRFKSELLNDLLARLKIEHIHSSSYYHPECNGPVEKVNDFICMIFAKQDGI